jgi:hypothetical protein
MTLNTLRSDVFPFKSGDSNAVFMIRFKPREQNPAEFPGTNNPRFKPPEGVCQSQTNHVILAAMTPGFKRLRNVIFPTANAFGVSRPVPRG